MTKRYRDASTGQYTTAAAATTRPAETVSETSSIERLIQRKKAEDPEIAAAYDMAELRRWLGDMRSLAEREGIYDGNASVCAIVVRVLPMLGHLAHMTEARDNARAEVERLTALVEAVREDARDIARDSGDDKGCYGVDFWAGMCKAAARIDGRIRHALDGAES